MEENNTHLFNQHAPYYHPFEELNEEASMRKFTILNNNYIQEKISANTSSNENADIISNNSIKIASEENY